MSQPGLVALLVRVEVRDDARLAGDASGADQELEFFVDSQPAVSGVVAVLAIGSPTH
jgi:hypothetical protein